MTTLPIFRRPEIIDINMPYADSGMNIRLAAGNLLGVFESKINRIKPAENVSAVIADALNKPTGSPPLGVLAKGKKRITIITSDHTRPVPSKNTMPVLLSEIRRTNPSAQIIILIATGFHRPSTREELIEKFGMQIASKEKIIVHDAFNEKQNIHLGRLSSGNELAIDQYACNTDLLIAEGFIEPHFFAGFSGGRKSVLPGIAGIKSILANHSSSMIAHPCARAGSLKNNPLHLDMIEAAEKAGLSFILNVIINHEKKIIKAFAGDFKKAHDRGTAYLKKLSRIKKTMSDIVITSN
ncbi:MAG TPA: nickel-dependent lactate racemase, partial [Spirochaetia bacterium]|nr:nickel-dependent lactate racemase [Spirochaetia bacterium]